MTMKKRLQYYYYPEPLKSRRKGHGQYSQDKHGLRGQDGNILATGVGRLGEFVSIGGML